MLGKQLAGDACNLGIELPRAGLAQSVEMGRCSVDQPADLPTLLGAAAELSDEVVEQQLGDGGTRGGELDKGSVEEANKCR